MMKNFKLLAFSVCAFGFLLSCNNDDDASVSECDFNVITDIELYEEPSPSNYNITNTEFSNNCLEITFGASGCDGNSWDVELVSDIPIVFGDNVAANISLKLTNPEVCEAYFTKTCSFDLSNIYGNVSRGVFTLEGWGSALEINN